MHYDHSCFDSDDHFDWYAEHPAVLLVKLVLGRMVVQYHSIVRSGNAGIHDKGQTE